MKSRASKSCSRAEGKLAGKLIVTGCARSGTTVLHALLGTFPDIKVFRYRETFHRKLDERDTDAMRKAYVVIKRPQLEPEDPRAFSLAELLTANYRILNLVRDARDVLVSRHPDDPERYWVEPPRWIAAVRDTLLHEQSPALLSIRYEDLVHEPRRELQRIAAALGIRAPDDYNAFLAQDSAAQYVAAASLQGARPLSPDSVGAWRRPENEERIAIIERDWGSRLRPLMGRLGYTW